MYKFEKYHSPILSDHATNLDDFYGKAWTVKQDSCTSYIPGETHAVNLGKVSKKINNGVQLDPNKTYHMVVFYMERGEAESNFTVNFTMTPANNDLKVTKALDTGDVVSEISDDLKANETFDYTIKENGNDTSGKGYKLTKSDGSTSNETLSNSGFNPAGYTKSHKDAYLIRSQYHHDQDHIQKRRNRCHNIRDPHQNIICGFSRIPGCRSI